MSEEIKKALTPRAFIIAVLISLFIIFIEPYIAKTGTFPLAGDLGGPATYISPAFPAGWMMGNIKYNAIAAIWWFLIPIFLIAGLPKNLRLTPQELALVYAMISVVPQIAWLNGPGGVVLSGYAALQYAHPVKTWVQDYYPKIISPLDIKVLQGMLAGGVTVPWSEWTIPLAFWLFNIISLWMSTTFWSALLRRLWVEIESLPFPIANITTNLIRQTEVDESGKTKLFRSKFLWIGVIIGLLNIIGETWYVFFPGFPRMWMFIDLTPLAYTTAVMYFGVELILLGFAFTLPMDILFTTPLAFIILEMILPPIWVSAGLLIPLLPGFHAHYVHNRTITQFEFSILSPMRGGYEWMVYSILFTLTIVPFIRNRNYFIDSFRSIFGKTKMISKEDASFDRMMWIGAIGFYVLHIVSLVVAQVRIEWAIFGSLITVMYWTSYARYRAETGQLLGGTVGGATTFADNVKMAQTPAYFFMPRDPAAITPYLAMFYPQVCQSYSGIGAGQPMPWLLDSYAVGDSVKASYKSVFTFQVVGVIASLVIVIPLWLWLQYTFGLVRGPLPQSWSLAGGAAYGSYQIINLNTTGYGGGPPREGALLLALFGIVLTIVMLQLRGRGGFFNYLTPWGIIFALNSGNCAWLPFIVAFAIKSIVTRIGGVKLYERTLLPLGIGLIVGCALMLPVNMTLHYLQGIKAL